MNKIEIQSKLFEIVANTLKITLSEVSLELAVGSIPQWDSLNHLALISAIETEFNTGFDLEDIMEIEEVEDFLDLLTKNI
jgi:acyl carrier protein